MNNCCTKRVIVQIICIHINNFFIRINKFEKKICLPENCIGRSSDLVILVAILGLLNRVLYNFFWWSETTKSHWVLNPYNNDNDTFKYFYCFKYGIVWDAVGKFMLSWWRISLRYPYTSYCIPICVHRSNVAIFINK